LLKEEIHGERSLKSSWAAMVRASRRQRQQKAQYAFHMKK
jgi:hypothetical protein